ncbi:hypothetical protein ACRRTK_022966 [Alexandromys fortis]
MGTGDLNLGSLAFINKSSHQAISLPPTSALFNKETTRLSTVPHTWNSRT